MSFMPDIGSLVRLQDGRTAMVTAIDPLGKQDKVRFADGSEEVTDAWKVADVVSWEYRDELVVDCEKMAVLLVRLDSNGRGFFVCGVCGRFDKQKIDHAPDCLVRKYSSKKEAMKL